MKKELGDKLLRAFPDIFPRGMCFDCGDGWYQLLNDLCGRIQHNIDQCHKLGDPEYPQLVAAQIKEKFGGLRFYVDNATIYAQALIEDAEKLSFKTCMNCGKPGELVHAAWLHVSCKECENESSS